MSETLNIFYNNIVNNEKFIKYYSKSFAKTMKVAKYKWTE